jgi:DNA-binding SARP family transcriptional activator
MQGTREVVLAPTAKEKWYHSSPKRASDERIPNISKRPNIAGVRWDHAEREEFVSRAGRKGPGPSSPPEGCVTSRTSGIVPGKVRVPTVHGIRRPRLHDLLLDHVREHQLALVVAPAGSGKTTLLAQGAALADCPVAWYRAESSDGNQRHFLRYLETALSAALPELPGGWRSVVDATRALEERPGTRVLLIIDDLHALQGTPAEQAIEQLIGYGPPGLAILGASRYPPGFNLPRLRVSGALLELGSDDLRFRTWEVERLFWDFYRQPLPPEDLAALARRTEGWAAGLQLFHLATRHKAAGERRRTLAALTSRARLAREYLARNVLEELPAELRSFLQETCVLGRLSGPLCDAFLGVSGSAKVLATLEKRQIFTQLVDDNGDYRYHEVLRSHLESVLVEEVGEAEARSRYRRAARLLEAFDDLPEALYAHCRGEDWEAVARLLGHRGEQIALGQGAWLDELPLALGQHDPWVLLATARRHRAGGRWKLALGAYRRAEQALGGQAVVDACRRERLALQSWMEPAPFVQDDWQGMVRRASERDPLTIGQKAARLPGPSGRLAAGLCALLAGQLREARSLLTAAIESPGAGPALRAGGRLARGIAFLLSEEPGGKLEVELAAEEAERAGIAWLVRLSHAALALTDRPDGLSEAASVRLAGERDADLWGSCLAGLFEGLGALRAGQDRRAVLERSAAGFQALGAPALNAWCRCVKVLMEAHAGAAGSRTEAEAAEAFARSCGLRGPLAFAYLALAESLGDDDSEERSKARGVSVESGLELPPRPAGTGPARRLPSRPGRPPSWQVRCFGGFTLSLSGEHVDLSRVRPRARQLLRLLAMHGGSSVHRETLIEALWPGSDSDTGARCLHVAISSVRHLLQSLWHDPSVKFIERSGDAYRLALPEDAEMDVVTFQHYFVGGRAARATGNAHRAVRAFERVLEIYRGDLLPEDGPAEWVVTTRERYRSEAIEAAQDLVSVLLERNDPVAAALHCERGLLVDRYRDPLWRMLIEAHDLAGDAASAVRARRRYHDMLDELGLPSGAPLRS